MTARTRRTATISTRRPRRNRRRRRRRRRGRKSSRRRRWRRRRKLLGEQAHHANDRVKSPPTTITRITATPSTGSRAGCPELTALQHLHAPSQPRILNKRPYITLPPPLRTAPRPGGRGSSRRSRGSEGRGALITLLTTRTPVPLPTTRHQHRLPISNGNTRTNLIHPHLTQTHHILLFHLHTTQLPLGTPNTGHGDRDVTSRLQRRH